MNRFFIGAVMGKSYIKDHTSIDEENIKSKNEVKEFFAWGINQLKKDILKKNEESEE